MGSRIRPDRLHHPGHLNFSSVSPFVPEGEGAQSDSLIGLWRDHFANPARKMGGNKSQSLAVGLDETEPTYVAPNKMFICIILMRRHFSFLKRPPAARGKGALHLTPLVVRSCPRTTGLILALFQTTGHEKHEEITSVLRALRGERGYIISGQSLRVYTGL